MSASVAPDFLAAPAPRWFTIAAHRPFLDDLASVVWRRLSSEGPDALADATLLLPTRRAAAGLARAFLKAAGGKALFLPRIRALGDLEADEPPFGDAEDEAELPPPIDPLRRRFELAALVARHWPRASGDLSAAAAVALADALAAFLDGCLLEECGDPAAIDGLVHEDLARHWQASAVFLKAALEAWPARLAELGVADAPDRRVKLLRRLAARWTRRPPEGVVIAAGSTGTAPAVADLLAVIATAPRGCVVLPGLDLSLAEDAWAEVDDCHPQGAMKALLARAGVDRAAVRPWDAAAEREPRGRWRRRLINEALRPAEAAHDWLSQIEALQREAPAGKPMAEGFAGLTLLRAADDDEAATLAALLLRESLETPGKSCALITPDATLGRRVSARLSRWGVELQPSLGDPLANAPAAVLADLLARAVADPLDSVLLLAIAKHPLVRPPSELGAPLVENSAEVSPPPGFAGPPPVARGENLDAAGQPVPPPRSGGGGPRSGGGGSSGAETHAARDIGSARFFFELHGLRGSRPRDRDTLLKRLADDPESAALAGWLGEVIDQAAAPFASGAAAPGDAARALAEALETLTGGDNPRIWQGADGEALAGIFAGLIGESGALPPATRSGFADLLASVIAGETLPPTASHPRLAILGALEARLSGADRLVLAGLEEGVWPRGGGHDPFLSRPMRRQLGLPSPERRVGLAAHDFAQAACAPEVFLISRERKGDAPAEPSRWIRRLEVLAKGAKVTPPTRPELLAWARELDAPLADPPAALRTASRPAPRPPVAVRPRKLYVERIERWVRDPYAIYAEFILKLKPLSLPGEPVDARQRGTAIHRAFETFAKQSPDALPDHAEMKFTDLYLAALQEEGLDDAALARERPLALNLAPWVIELERRRRPGARLFVENKGELRFSAVDGKAFTLICRADRIEDRGARADILDVKTGRAPGKAEVKAHFAPQLTITAAILARGGFAEIGARSPGELVYIQASGTRVPGVETICIEAADAPELAENAFAGLNRRIAHFDRADTPYTSWFAPKYQGRQGGDYDHLARVWEWMVIGEAAEGEAS